LSGDQELVEAIRAGVIGDDEAVMGPFGLRRVTYADYTASGRSLGFIEDYIREAVLPLYANTHTESSGTGLQTGRFREEAREIIRTAIGGNRAAPHSGEVLARARNRGARAMYGAFVRRDLVGIRRQHRDLKVRLRRFHRRFGSGNGRVGATTRPTFRPSGPTDRIAAKLLGPKRILGLFYA